MWAGAPSLVWVAATTGSEWLETASEWISGADPLLLQPTKAGADRSQLAELSKHP